MFVKIQRKQNALIQRETLYECGHYDVEHTEDEIVIKMEECPASMGKQTLEVKLKKRDLSVYFMNGDGKTIDSLHFERKKDGSHR